MIYLLCFSSGCSSCHPCSDSLHFRNLIRPVRPKIKGPLELSVDRSLPLAMVHMGLWDLLHVILSKTSREKKCTSPRLSVDAGCAAFVIRAAENIALQPVSCTKSPVCRAWHAPVSPQLTHTGRLFLTFLSSSPGKTFPASKGGLSHTPSHRLQRPFSSYTSL